MHYGRVLTLAVTYPLNDLKLSVIRLFCRSDVG